MESQKPEPVILEGFVLLMAAMFLSECPEEFGAYMEINFGLPAAEAPEVIERLSQAGIQAVMEITEDLKQMMNGTPDYEVLRWGLNHDDV